MMALVATSSAPHAALVATPPVAHLAAACRVVGTAEAHLHYSCLNAAPGYVRDCESAYWWAVTLPLQLEPVSSLWQAPSDGVDEGDAVEVSVRAESYEEAERVVRRFALGAQLACLLDATGAVRSVGGPNATAPVLPAAPTPRRLPAAASATQGPLALALLHAAWGTLLGRMGAQARPPPGWLTRLGWLPWGRCCGAGAPLLVLSSLSHLGRSLRGAPRRDAGALGALSVSAMLAAAGEAAAALLREARRSAAHRVASGASLLPVWATVAYVAVGAAVLAACVAEPLQREMQRILAAAAQGEDSAEQQGSPVGHPLGEPLPRRAMTRALSSGRISPGAT